MTQEQAKYISGYFKIVTAYNAPTAVSTLSSGKVFQDLHLPVKTLFQFAARKKAKIFLMISTSPSKGLPSTQLRDMVNWWLRENTRAGNDLIQIEIKETLIYIDQSHIK
ncbi:hypothetical protein EJG51_009140 [Undibacterium piscinae]|uniref:Uncharacterized protein n=1 Tax=Undibacterium piscinae TaxID=2495591 RepID=A0A6M4A7E8_9BURK|nr:hypothetical protein EJG51_009140 [Undibacterium piscinae]